MKFIHDGTQLDHVEKVQSGSVLETGTSSVRESDNVKGLIVYLVDFTTVRQ